MNFPRILIATDFSKPSFEALELGAYTRHMDGSEVILLNVREYALPFLDIESTPKHEMLEAYRQVYNDQAQKKLGELAQKHFHKEKVRQHVIVSTNRVGDEICDYAEKEDCSLIIMGSRGVTTLGTLFVGSTVQRVLAKTKIPVLVIPPSDRK